VLLLAALVTAVTRWTRFGRELRAVVDNRTLAALGGIDADRVSAVGWAFGSFTAGFTGVLLAPYVRLDPYGLPLLVVEVIAVAVLARMKSLTVAVVSALATLAVGVGVSRFVFAQPYATAGLSLSRPAGLSSDRAYYVVELVVLAGALLAVAALRRGRTGRALAALRDHEPGASAAGVRVASLKLLAFVLGAALAALGGGLLGMGLRAFDPAAYDPIRGLLWFAAVVVLGADNLVGPLVAAALLVGLDAGARGGVAAALIGILAILIGRFPDGPNRVLQWLGLAHTGSAGGPERPARPRGQSPGRAGPTAPARPLMNSSPAKYGSDTGTSPPSTASISRSPQDRSPPSSEPTAPARAPCSTVCAGPCGPMPGGSSSTGWTSPGGPPTRGRGSGSPGHSSSSRSSPR